LFGVVKCNTLGKGIADAGDEKTVVASDEGTDSWSLTGVGAAAYMKGTPLAGVHKRAGLLRATVDTTESVEWEVVFTRPRTEIGEEITGILGIDRDEFWARMVEGKAASCRLLALLLLL
jgi:hypothetical protein